MIRYLRDEPAAFGPDAIRVMSHALHDAWVLAQADQSGFCSEGHESAMRDVLAAHIIAMAKKGERDRARLAESALSRLRL